MVRIRIEHASYPVDEYELEEPTVTVGRGVENTLHFRDPWLSREHARFVAAEGGGYNLEDVGSRNGTFLNGQLLQGARELS
ncbi:MAG: FHA domain-containing protein, partial [Holophagales bacterium]|nr:FHA domain-containing protein [Holophagales bacterium]